MTRRVHAWWQEHPEGVHTQHHVSPAASCPTAAAGDGQDGRPGGLSWTLQSSLPCGKCGLKWFSAALYLEEAKNSKGTVLVSGWFCTSSSYWREQKCSHGGPEGSVQSPFNLREGPTVKHSEWYSTSLTNHKAKRNTCVSVCVCMIKKWFIFKFI